MSVKSRVRRLEQTFPTAGENAVDCILINIASPSPDGPVDHGPCVAILPRHGRLNRRDGETAADFIARVEAVKDEGL